MCFSLKLCSFFFFDLCLAPAFHICIPIYIEGIMVQINSLWYCGAWHHCIPITQGKGVMVQERKYSENLKACLAMALLLWTKSQWCQWITHLRVDLDSSSSFIWFAWGIMGWIHMKHSGWYIHWYYTKIEKKGMMMEK